MYHMIRALPAIVKEHPDVLYVVLGATHPNVIRHDGEKLRASLQGLAQDLGVQNHVRFINAYVGIDELLDYLQAADIYVPPYNNPAQVTSGTLSYAVALGKRSEEHTSELQSLMRISYAVFCLKKKKNLTSYVKH